MNMQSSKISEHTHEHKDGSRKISVIDIPGVSIVRGSHKSNDKLAVTPAGRQRLIEELQR
jgi:hypothetical protein